MRATTVVSICGVVVFLAYELTLRRRDHDGASWRSGEGDRRSTQLILGAYAAVVAVNIAFGGVSAGTLAARWRWIGAVFLAAGLALRGWSMATLGQFYTRTLRTVDEHNIVDSGPYRLVRHPGYSGSLLVWNGYALALGNWIAAAITALLLLSVYVWRINAEEALLVAAFGDRYADYERETKRLIPFLY